MTRSNRVEAQIRLEIGERKGICVTYDAEGISAEKRNLIEEAGNAFLDQAAEILNRKD